MDKEYIIVRSKESLEKAIEDNVENIVIKGELAEELTMALSNKLPDKIDTAATLQVGVNPLAILLGVAAIAAVPFTLGLSGGAAATTVAVHSSGIAAAAATGITAITAVSLLGSALILMIIKDYNPKVTAKADGYGETTIELNRK